MISKEKWLVKAGGKILGPFSLEELTEHLKERNLSLIDEVRDPRSRWCFIREQPELRNLVGELREQESSENEATQTTYVGGKTSTISLEDTQTQEAELTPVPSVVEIVGAKASKPTKEIPHRTSAYASPMDRRVQQGLKREMIFWRKSFWLALVTLVVASILVGGYWFKSNHDRKTKSREWAQLGRDQARLGEYEKALDFIHRASQLADLNDEISLLRAQLLLVVQGQTEQPLRTVTSLRSLKEPAYQKEMLLTRALIHMRGQRWDEASEVLTAFRQQFPEDPLGHLNWVLLQYQRGDFLSARQSLSQVQDSPELTPLKFYLRGLLALNWPQAIEAADIQRTEVKALLDQAPFAGFLSFELNVILASLLTVQERFDDALKVLLQMWTMDPLASRRYYLPLLVDRQVLDWDRFAPVCDRLSRQFPNDQGALAVRAICLFQRGLTADALQDIDQSRKILSKSSLLLSVHSLLLLQADRTGEARQLSQMTEDSVLSHIVRGQVCEYDRDWSCSEEAWKEVLKMDPTHPTALEGLAAIEKIRGNEMKARDLIKAGLAKYPNYRPFLEIKGDIRGL